MKVTTFLFLLLSVFYGYSQDYTPVENLSKKCMIVNYEDVYGLVYNKAIVADITYLEYEAYNGLAVFYSDSGSVCYNAMGEKVLDLPNAKIYVTEWDNFIIAAKGNKQALYTNSGKEIIPLGSHEFNYYQNGMHVIRNPNSPKKEEAFLSEKGEVIIPFGTHKIAVQDEYENIIGITEGEETTIFLNGSLNLPMNFSKLNDFTFVKDMEVSIGEYITFLGSQKYDGFLYDPTTFESTDYKTLIPDTNKVEPKVLPLYRALLRQLDAEENFEMSEMEVELTNTIAEVTVPFEIDKSLLPLMKFPVTGVTLGQAKAYCEWLKIVQMERELTEFVSMVDYRIPTEEEWLTMANQALLEANKQNGAPDSLNAENCMLFVFNSTQQCKNYSSYLKASKGGGSVPVKSANLDMSGRYHVFGNVAEMIDESEKAKGGSFIQTAKEANANQSTTVKEAQPWLGFRIVGEYHFW